MSTPNYFKPSIQVWRKAVWVLLVKPGIICSTASIYDPIIDCASGQSTNYEILGIGELELVPWQIGAVL